MSRRFSVDFWVALVLVLACAVFWWQSFLIEDMGYVTIGSEVWPRAILAALTPLVLMYLSRSVGRPEADPVKDSDGAWGSWIARYRNPIWCFLLFFLFLLAIPYIGMLVGGVLFVFLTLTVLGERTLRHHVVHALIALVMIVSMWAIFRFALGVLLPEGDFFHGLL